MTRLVLEMRCGDHLLINGAEVSFPEGAKIILTRKADLLYGRQVMSAVAATTLPRMFYLAVQEAYAGGLANRAGNLQQVVYLAAQITACCSDEVGDAVREAVQLALTGKFYPAVRSARQAYVLDDSLLLARAA